MSLDGKVATQRGESRWITGSEARQLVHHWRDSHEAILVGANTIRVDDPALTARLDAESLDGRLPSRQPLRIVLAGQRPLPPDAQLFQDGLAATLVVTTEACEKIHKPLLNARRGQVELLSLPGVNGYPDPAALLNHLYDRQIVGLLVEGGPHVAASFLNAGLVDRLTTFIAPKLIGAGGMPAFCQTDVLDLAEAPILQEMESQPAGSDLCITGKPLFPHLETENKETTQCLPVSLKK